MVCNMSLEKLTKVEVGVETVVVSLQVAFQQRSYLSSRCWQLLVHTLFSSCVRPQEVAKSNVLLLKPLLCNHHCHALKHALLF